MNAAANGLDLQLMVKMGVMGAVMTLDRAHVLGTYENKHSKGHY